MGGRSRYEVSTEGFPMGYIAGDGKLKMVPVGLIVPQYRGSVVVPNSWKLATEYQSTL